MLNGKSRIEMQNHLMEENHLTARQIEKAADAISTQSAINLSDELKRHIQECESCHEQVVEQSELLKVKIQGQISNSLNNVSPSFKINAWAWIIGIIIIVAIALIYYLYNQEYITF